MLNVAVKLATHHPVGEKYQTFLGLFSLSNVV